MAYILPVIGRRRRPLRLSHSSVGLWTKGRRRDRNADEVEATHPVERFGRIAVDAGLKHFRGRVMV